MRQAELRRIPDAELAEVDGRIPSGEWLSGIEQHAVLRELWRRAELNAHQRFAGEFKRLEARGK